MRSTLWGCLLVTACVLAGCDATPAPGTSASARPSTSTSATPSPSTFASATQAAPAAAPGTVSLRCDNPIDVLPSPPRPYTETLGVVGLDLSSGQELTPGGRTDPHRFFAKTGLLVRAGQPATV